MTSGSFEIRELDGDERTITLRERCLPERGSLKFSGKHRMTESTYPGSPNTGQQALGAQELPSTFKGEWNDRYLGDRQGGANSTLPMAELGQSQDVFVDGFEAVTLVDNAIPTVAELVNVLDDFRKKGMPIRVSIWHLTRIGRIDEFSHDWDTENDCRWGVSFKWISQTDSEAQPSPASPDSTRNTAALSSKIDDITDALSFEAVDDLSPEFVETIDGRIARAQASIQSLDDATRATADGVASKIETVRRALALISDLQGTASDLVDDIETITAGAVSLGADVDDLTSVPPAVLVSIECGQRRAAAAARALRQEATLRRRALLATVEDNILDVVIVRDGEDLRTYARRYYGNASDWDRIRSFNGLNSSTVSLGDVIIIPALEAAAA